MSWFRKAAAPAIAPAIAPEIAPARRSGIGAAASYDLQMLSISARSEGGIGRVGVKKAMELIDKLDETSDFGSVAGSMIELNKVDLVKKVLNKAQEMEVDIGPAILKRYSAKEGISDEIKAVVQEYLDGKNIQSPRTEAAIKNFEAEVQQANNDGDPTDDLEDFLKEMVKDMAEGAQPELLAPGDKYPELLKALKCLDPKKAPNAANAAPASNLPPGWVAKVSSKSGKTYYEKNGKSQWNKPTAGGKRRTMNRKKNLKKTRRNRK
jgi:hypothetical protein